MEIATKRSMKDWLKRRPDNKVFFIQIKTVSRKMESFSDK